MMGTRKGSKWVQTYEAKGLSMQEVIVKRWQVVRTAEGRKLVVRKERPLAPGEEIIANTPHEGDDFSYMCGSDYCRCMQ